MAAEDANKSSSGGWTPAAILGWGGLAVATAGFIWFISTQLAIGYAGKEKDALEVAKNWKSPAMSARLDDLKLGIQEAARQNGLSLSQFSWSSVQGDKSVYKVSLLWMEGSQHKKATWNVDLKDGTVTLADPAAIEFVTRLSVKVGFGGG